MEPGKSWAPGRVFCRAKKGPPTISESIKKDVYKVPYDGLRMRGGRFLFLKEGEMLHLSIAGKFELINANLSDS